MKRINEFARGITAAAGGLTRFQTCAIIILLCLLLIGGVCGFLHSRPREIEVGSGQTVQGATKETQNRMLTVHVAGAVQRPGLYRVKEGARVADALSEAGGATPEGILDDLNLASRLKDGEKVLVPRSAPTGQILAASSPETTNLVNINTASQEELDALPGVGPSLAKRIIDYRTRNGSFSAVEELDNVEGIGPAKLENFKGLVTI